MPVELPALDAPELYVRQRREIAELFGFETRNKYAIRTPDQREVAFAAEPRKSWLDALARHFLGHFRRFEIVIFDANRREILRALHPFRFFFQRLEIHAGGAPLGALQQRMSVLSKRFDVLDAQGHALFEMRSGLFRIWTFPFFRGDRQVAVIEKKWSGALSEVFTDKDSFRVAFEDPSLTRDERALVLASALFVDLQYFERKSRA
jgi:uncharacterized protein YxjI